MKAYYAHRKASPHPLLLQVRLWRRVPRRREVEDRLQLLLLDRDVYH